jgi:hypothetical protein
VIDSWELWSTGGFAKPRVTLRVAGWDPEPGGTDLVLGRLGDPRPTIIAEVKVLDVDQTLWDLMKVVSMLEHETALVRGYLIVATTPKRWRDAEVAAWYAPPNPDAPEGVRTWRTRQLFNRLEGVLGVPAQGWPRSSAATAAWGPHAVYGSHPIPAFPAYELRCIAVEPLAEGPPVAFDEDGWPTVAKAYLRTHSLKELVLAHHASQRYANAHADLRDYHRDRAAALGRALGVDLDGAPPRSDDAFLALIRSTEAQLQRTESPFADFIEAPESVVGLYHEHGAALAEAADGFHDRLVHLLVAIVARMWDIQPDAVVTDEDLTAGGFDPSVRAPDPLDYL